MEFPTRLVELAGENWVTEMQETATLLSENPSLDNLQAFYDKLGEYGQACLDAGELYGGFKDNAFKYDNGSLTLFPGRILNIAGTYCGLLYGDDTFTVVDLLDSDYYKLACQNFAEYYKKGYYISDIASASLTGFEDGTLDFTPYMGIVTTHNAYSDDTEAQLSARYGEDVTVIRLHDSGLCGLGSSSGMSIPYCADEPERAMMVLNELYTNAELYQLLIYGIEGEHYTDNGDGTITTGYGSQATSDSAYGLWKWTIGTCENSLVTEGDTPGYYEELKELEKSAYVSPFLSFSFDQSEVSDIITGIKAADKQYVDMLLKGYTGDEWEDTYNKLMDERKKAGVDQFIEEIQKQIDEYVKENNITSWNYNGE